MFPLPYGETVIRQRPALALDRTSGENTRLDWSTPDVLAIPGCGFDPGDSSEPLQQGRDAVVTHPAVYAPSGSDVRTGDRMVVRGRTWQVDGDPSDFRSPFGGWAAGMVIRLKAVSG